MSKHFIKRLSSWLALTTVLTISTAHAATYYWDADTDASGNNIDGTNLGGPGTWDTSTGNWWNSLLNSMGNWPNTAFDEAIFSEAYVAGAPVAKTVTVTPGISANRLTFLRSGYTLTGGTITLAGTAPTLHANLGESATISSQLLGSAGLTLTGGGSIRLTNNTNSYTGQTTISNGSLIITNQSALGADSSAISILTNNNTPQNANLLGFTGGSLVLDGTAAGFTFARDVNFEGRGPIGDRGAAIQSLGNNTLSGTLNSAVSPLTPATVRNSRINSVNGTLTLSGTLNAGGTSATTFTSLGGVNSAGVGNFDLTGVLAGTGSIEKSGAGTLFLNPSSTAGFAGTVRISASSTGQQSSVRVTQTSVAGTSTFGANVGTTTAAAIDLNGGVLEFRNDGNLNFGALASGKNVYTRSTGIIFTGPAAGGSGINGTTTLGALHQNASGTTGTNTTTFNSRNGFGVTMSTFASDASTSTTSITTTLANNMGGNLTFTGNLTMPEGSTASRPRVLAIGGTGNTVIQGSVIAGTDVEKDLTKSGAGNLTIQGVGTTVAGDVSITAGAITITDFRSLNNNTALLSLGNATTTGGNLIIGGTGVTPTNAGLTTSKTIRLNTTSGSNSIYANQTGINPVILNGAITKIAAATTGALILGGTNTADNIINVVIPVETTPSTGGVTKIGTGTWVLNAANTYAGATTIQNGTLKLRATAAASDVIKEAASNTIVFSANATTGTAGGTLEFRGFSGAATTETLGALTPTAGAATVRLLGNGGSAANLTFTSLGATAAASSVNFDTTDANGGVITLTGQAATTATTLPGTANFLGHLYINGADFATINGSAQVVAPTYGAVGNFREAAAALTGAFHNKLTGSFTNAAATVSSLVTNSQTLTLSGNLTLSTGGLLQSGGTASIVSDGATPRLILGGAAATNIAIRVNAASDVLNIGSAANPVNIGSTQTGGLTKNGAGKLVFFGTNAQTGTININEGTIELNGTNARLAALAGTATVVRQDAFLDFNTAVAFAANPTVAALDGAGTIRNIGSVDVTLVQTGAGTWAGSFNETGSGKLNVSKLGTTGAPVWSGISNYTGVTTIGGTTGLVTVNSLDDGGVASGIGASSNAASNLVFAGSTAGLVFQGSIVNGALTLGSRSASTDRLFTLSGTGATLSSTASNNNAIVWSSTGAIVHGVTSPQSLIFTGTSTGDNTFNPQLTDSGVGANITSLSKTAAGQWNLGNSNNTYTGITTVSDGILGLNDNGALPGNSPLVLGTTTTSGILQMSGAFARNLAATATAGTGTITWGGTTGGGGFAAHSTALTVTLDAGAGLTWGIGGFVGTGGLQALIFNSGSALSDVTFTNAIDLGTAVRTITVNDNSNTGADYATMSGILSSGAGGGLLKNGAGILRLTAANAYTGTTAVEAGTLVVSSLGSSTGGASSSVGAGGVPMDDTNAIVLGNATTGGGILQYVGAGETSDRKIRLRGTTAGNQIHADGVGPLILTNVAHDTTETGNKTLSLRGSNAAGNMITSPLSDNGAGVLSVGVDGNATWILTNSANNYTGTTTVGAGALGIGHDTAIPAALTISNGNVFAYGGDRTLTNTLNIGNNATSGFIGDYSLTFNGTNNLAAGANNLNLYNSIAPGKALILNGLLANSLTATRAWALDGPGETVVNGNFTTTTGFGVNITKSGNGTLTLGTTGATSNWNQAGNVLDMDRGTLKFTADDAIPTTFGAAATTTSATVPIATTTYTVASTAGLVAGQTFTGTNVPAGSRILTIDSATTFTTTIAPTTAVANGAALTFLASGGLTLSPEVATTDTVTVDLNGTTQTVNALTATSDGTTIIDNTSINPATFRFGANNSAVVFGSGVGTYTIQNTGAGALSLVKLGNTAVTFISGITIGHKGITASEGGGVFTIGSPLTATTGLRAIGNSTLALTGGLTNPNLITSIEVGGGSTLSLLDGAGSLISNLSTLSLGNTGTGTVTLNLNVGTGATDTLTLLTGNAASLGNTITFNMTDAGLDANQTYTLLNLVDGGLTTFGLGNLIQGATPGGFDSMTWNVTNNLVQITTGNIIVGDLYWRGITNNAWNANPNNWSLNKDGSGLPASIPGQGTRVIFAYDSVGAAPLTTTLEQNIKINSLVFEAGATTPASVTINPGTIATNRLEIAPTSSANGIAITTGGPTAVTIGANLRLGANQTWDITGASTLTVGGALFGEANVTKAGGGRVILSAAADPTFNSGQTAVITVAGGNLEFTNSGALGSLANSNVASIVVNGGGFYYNNATAGTAATLPHAITLNGGALSGGGANHTYGGTVNIAGASTINMADSNTVLTGAARSITLSGVVSGAGSLTIDSNNTASNGNQLGGTLTISNAASTWAGNLIFNRGTVTIAATASPTVTPLNVTFNSFGRLILQGVDGQTINRAGILDLAAGAVAEFQVDNTTVTQVTDFVVNQNGAVTLGSGGTGASLRVALVDTLAKLNIVSGVTLGGSSSISVSNNAARLLTISGVISDGGSGYGLAINDDAGGWAQTNGTVRLSALNTFTGNFTLGEGIVEFDTVTNISGGASSLGNGTALTTGAGTLRFIGGTSQATDRPITMNGATIFGANGTGGATITYNGAISAGTNAFTLTGLAGSTGVMTGGITQTDDAADGTVNGGTWTHQTGTSRVGDDLTLTGATTILNLTSGLLQVRDDFATTVGANLNLNGTGVLSFDTATLSADASLRVQNGAIITFGANNPVVVTNFDGLRVGTDDVGVGTLNTVTFNQGVSDFILGNRNADRSGLVNGTGTITASNNFDLFGGTVNANLASTGAVSLDKHSMNTVTLAADNSGLAGTGATVINEGSLILNYAASTATKLRGASALDMLGGNLTLLGNSGAAVVQDVGSFTLANGGSNYITLTAAGQDLVLNLNAITRGNNAQDGTVRIVLPSGTQSATNGVTTDSLNTVGTGANAILGGWATVTDATGTYFARNATNAANGNIVAANTTLADAVGSWVAGDNVSDSVGFTGTLTSPIDLNSLRFNAAAGSTLNFGSSGHVRLTPGGGILVTSNVGGAASINGGAIEVGTFVQPTTLNSANDLIVVQDSSSVFEIGASLYQGTNIIKSGAGTLHLSGNNSYTGTTELLEGILQVSGGNAIGNTSLVTLTGRRATTLQLLADETIGRLQGGSRQTDQDLGTVDVGAFTLTMNQSASSTYSGAFAGSGSIVMALGGTGNFTYNGRSSTATFTGSVIVNGGLFLIGGATARLEGATSFAINGATANFLIDNNDDGAPNDRIGDSASFVLNSAAGPFSGNTQPRGLAIRTDNNGNESETIGAITFAGGANYSSLEASGGTSAVASIISSGWTRLNNATANVRGRNLGGTANERAQFKVADANDAAMIAANVGGGGVIGGTAKNVSIIPWAIGQSISAGLAVTDMGNTFLSYVDNRGFVPLSLTNEFSTFGTAAAGDNVRESLLADLTGLAGATVNSLILHNDNTAASTINVTGTGAGQALNITSGALLVTLNTGAAASSAHAVNLSGYDSGIVVGGTNEYVIHVVNPSSAATTANLTLTIGSALTSVADITKSGRGTLVLTQVNAAGGATRKTVLNEGVLEITDLDNIGGGTGGLVFAGGTLRLGAGFADDLSTRTVSILQGGATLDMNGNSLTLANSIGGGGAGGFAKIGAGDLTLNAAAGYSGATQFTNGTLTIGVNNALPVGTSLLLGSGTTNATLDTNAFNQTLGALINTTNSTTLTTQVVVDPGTTLTVNGQVLIGANAAPSTTLFTAIGGGSFVQNQTAGTFQLGGGTGATNTNAATADFSGLANFTSNLGLTGIFRVGDNNTNTSGSPSTNSTVTLAGTASVITAGILGIGDAQGQGGTTTLELGAGTNTINADTVYIGAATSSARSSGALVFDSASGSLTLRGSAGGSSRADVAMTTATTGTGFNQVNTFLTAGHSADLMIDSFLMSDRTGGTGSVTSTFTFDQGTLDITALTMARRTGGGGGDATADVTIGGGTAVIGSIEMGQSLATTAGSDAIADLNITGGTVTLGTGSGTAVNLANAGAGRTATSTIDLTGGTTTVTGNIVRTGGLGTENASVTLDGGALNMSDNNIGTATEAVTFNALSGSLSTLNQLNDGVGNLTKGGVGTLEMLGTSDYTNATLVDEGTLLVSGTLSGTTAVTVADGGTLAGTGIVNPLATVTVQTGGTLSPGNSPGVLNTGSVDLSAANSTFKLELGGTTPGLHDQLAVTGGVTLGGNASVSLFGAYITSALVGDTFTVILNDGIGDAVTGTFANASLNYLIGTDGSEYSVNYAGGDGNDVVLTLAVVPEPGAVVSLLGGLGMLLGMQRFRRRR